MNFGIKPTKLSRIILCSWASEESSCGEINFSGLWVFLGTTFKIFSAKNLPNIIPKKDLFMVVKTTKPPERHNLEMSDRKTFLSFTCSITSEAMTISNLFKNFSFSFLRRSVVVIHL